GGPRAGAPGGQVGRVDGRRPPQPFARRRAESPGHLQRRAVRGHVERVIADAGRLAGGGEVAGRGQEDVHLVAAGGLAGGQLADKAGGGAVLAGGERAEGERGEAERLPHVGGAALAEGALRVPDGADPLDLAG